MPQTPKLAGAPYCGPSIRTTEPTAGGSLPPPAPSYFAPDFPTFPDERTGATVGGFGGLHRGAPLHHTPVIFVHGNQADAQNWLDVMLQFQNDAGYSMQEMYALSYNGLQNYYAGTPDHNPPTSLDQDYVQQNPTSLSNGGHGAADDDEVPDMCRMIEAVQWYTGSRQVDIVTHSLGDTIVRETMRLYPSLASDVVAFVGIAGANHGTTVCRGIESSYYGCDEIAPGTAWLARLNGPGGSRETYAPTRWMTVYNGSAGDPFFDGPDEGSPPLAGADNRTFPGTYHNDLRVDPPEVDTYLSFLLAHGQAGPGADAAGAAQAARITRAQPDGETGTLCGVPKLTGPVAGCSSGTGTGAPHGGSAAGPSGSSGGSSADTGGQPAGNAAAGSAIGSGPLPSGAPSESGASGSGASGSGASGSGGSAPGLSASLFPVSAASAGSSVASASAARGGSRGGSRSAASLSGAAVTGMVVGGLLAALILALVGAAMWRMRRSAGPR